ncbi:helix-turn-helix domain-containing protein [Streptomyces sp. NPDC091281]|uniref:helix-turn-helix domain-containing protein n=1 Tax=Streptomyces sp. NPDC091281 TaxID=3365985 RepID=UPI00381F5375
MSVSVNVKLEERAACGAGRAAVGRPLGAAVRARRLELGVTQEYLAHQAGMTQGALSRMECGRGVPTLPLLERLAAALSANLLISIPPYGGIHVAFKALPR